LGECDSNDLRYKPSSITFIAKRSPGYDLITGKILQELPPTAVKYLTQLFNAAMLIGYFPMQWKVATYTDVYFCLE
jgi:hypothetical protein